jgi:AcrR family transcriptional regulator
MKQDKQDRRSQRTRHLVNTAMIELILEKPYDAISVQDILDRAGIGRSTFYTHYFDKEDVLTSIADQMLEIFGQQFSQRNVEHGLIPCLELFQHVQQNYHNFRSLLRGHAGEVLWEAAQTTLSRTIEQALTNASAVKCPPAVPLPVVAQYLAGSFLNLLKWWLRAEMPYTPEHMESIFQQLALPGVWATVEGKKGK